MSHLIDTRYGLIESFDLSDLISRFLSLYGEWSYIEVSFLNSILNTGETILDAGAYIGTFSLGVSQTQPKLIVAVEPNPKAYVLLRGNLIRNLQVAFAIENCLIGKPDGMLSIGQCTESENLGALTFYHQDQFNKNETNTLQNIKADCLSLKDIRLKYGSFSFIKLDIEGWEQEAIESDAEWISKELPTIWLECNEHNRSISVFELLKSFGYKIYYFCYPAFNPNNFKNEKTKIFPVAFEAGILAVSQSRQIICPNNILAVGAELKLIETNEDLKYALWLTPRWGLNDWQYFSNTQLLALCSRLIKGERFENFLKS